MKKGFKGQGIVERVEFPNKGLVRTEEGEQVVVKNTIPGQKVEFLVNKVKQDFLKCLRIHHLKVV